MYLPLIVPQPAFLFGLQMLFLAMGFNTSFAALVLVHLVFVLPYVFLSLSDPWRAFDNRYALSALSMGVGRNRIFWSIRLPMLLRPCWSACRHRLCRFHWAISADSADRRRSLADPDDRGRGSGLRRRSQDHRRLCISANGTSVYRIFNGGACSGFAFCQ